MAGRGRGGYRPPQTMIVRDVIFGEPKGLPNKSYEQGISLLVTVGNWPAHGTTYRFIVNGTPVGNEQLVVEGRATAKVVLPQGKSTIAVELRHPQFGVRLVSLAEKELGDAQEKKKKEVAKLLEMGTTSDKDAVYTSLARVDNSGKGKKGAIAYFDPNTGDLLSEDSDNHGIAVIKIERGETRQTATFYLPEKPGEKITKEIPAKKVVPIAPQPQESKQPLADRLREAYRRGRQG